MKPTNSNTDLVANEGIDATDYRISLTKFYIHLKVIIVLTGKTCRSNNTLGQIFVDQPESCVILINFLNYGGQRRNIIRNC